MTAAALSSNTSQIRGTIANARFLDIGERQIVAGTLGDKTFYSPPVEGMDGDVIHTAEGSFRIQRSLQIHA